MKILFFYTFEFEYLLFICSYSFIFCVWIERIQKWVIILIRILIQIKKINLLNKYYKTFMLVSENTWSCKWFMSQLTSSFSYKRYFFNKTSLYRAHFFIHWDSKKIKTSLNSILSAKNLLSFWSYFELSSSFFFWLRNLFYVLHAIIANFHLIHSMPLSSYSWSCFVHYITRIEG